MYFSKKALISLSCLFLISFVGTATSEVSFITPPIDKFKKAFKEKPKRISSKQKKALQKEQAALTALKEAEEASAANDPNANPLQDVQINLREPVFSQGVIKTDQGGVITGEGIRIQAQNIEYTNKIENGLRVLKIVAEGDLMMEYGDRAFVGKKLEYDFIKKTGTVTEGKTYVDIWFLGGDKIELRADGSYYIYNAFVTTCESQENMWEINSETVKITKDHLLAANNIKFRFFKIPLFWLPTFRSNLKLFSDPPIRYKLVWDKGLGPRATMRYRIFSWEDFDLFFRLDYRLKRGFGGALESEYYSPNERTVFVTRSYGAHDKEVPEERGPRRYRFQGLLSHQSADKKTYLNLTYDKFSDLQMIDDFRSNDFVIDTQKRTRLLFNHQEESVFGTLSFQPQINDFESINQQLPLVTMGIRPFAIGPTGIISENYVNAGYLKYTFAQELHNEMHGTRAARIETQNRLYRPIRIGPTTLTPVIGVVGIFYNNNPLHNAVGQAIFTYGGEFKTEFYRAFSRHTHRVEPYVKYTGLSQPKAGLNDHFVFSMDDGYFKMNNMRAGVRNYLFSHKTSLALPVLSVDVFTNAFFNDSSYKKAFPKAYTSIGWNRPSYALYGDVCWNFEEQVLDFFNTRTEITVNEDFAFGLEYRHRSRFDWRKGNHEDFTLDVARSIPELLESPLSDGRNTFLSRFQARLSPKWTCHLQTLTGWGRKGDPMYNAEKIDITTLLPCNWRLKFSYSHTPDDDRFSTQIQLAK